ncbi:metal ABC transporter solute-binding protein, Zn/Mn family [Alkalicoccus chagannorensis]|uniref:metal ABC transporter solute-binding protein, Zn/Mn family n=1 Tax=Alkalicoccus chagannorensis TaxID=427072 RepID=UPI0004260A9A|nr:zinc ABC transporter substrate-binding protein [Alkalicoccus chagannorensis]
MKKSLGLIAAAGLLLTACIENDEGAENTSGNADAGEENDTTNNNDEADENSENSGELQVTTSISVFADMIEQVGGDRVQVDYVVPRGEEPEEHEPTPGNFTDVADSEVFFVNGMNLESWLESMMDNAGDTPTVELTEGIDPINMPDSDAADPHAWLNPQHAQTYVDNIQQELSDLDPEGAADYEANADAYREELASLDADVEEMLSSVPEEHRLVTISENALVYFGDRYDFETRGIWELNSHEEGTPQQISALVSELTEREVPYVFTESTVSPNHMETVSENADIPIYEDVLYTDAVSVEGEGVETYIEMMEHNASTLASALGESE